MQEATVRKLRFLALQLVGAVAVIHLVVGAAQLSSIASHGLLDEYLTGRVFIHPRALLFVLSGLAVLVGVVTVAAGRIAYRTAYLLGIGMLATYVVGWVAWHTVLNHGLALDPAAGSEVSAHSHGGLVETFLSHYVEPLAAVVTASGSGRPGTGRVLLGVVSKTLELAGLVVLVVLVRRDPRAGREGRGRGWRDRLTLRTPEREE